MVGLGVLVKTGNEGITALGVADGSVDGVAEGASVAPRHCMQRTELIGIIDIVEIGSAGEMIPAKPAQIAISQDGVRGDKHLRSAAVVEGQ